tara:strand:- start:80 stop:3565 length:3486 start_codon:yes stop_codon:yes gene_type:complete
MDFVLDSNQCNQITNDDTWTVIKKYFEQKGFIRHHLNSYNKFVEHDIQKIISEMYPIIVNSNIYEIKNDDYKRKNKLVLTFGDISINNTYIQESDGTLTKMTPDICRLRNLTYQAEIYVNVLRTIYQINIDLDEEIPIKTDSNKILIGKLPIMLKSNICVLNNLTIQELQEKNECIYEQGGYFIVNGSEKVLMSSENVAKNKLICNLSQTKNQRVYILHEIMGQYGTYNTSFSISYEQPTKTSPLYPHKVFKVFIKKIHIPLIILFKAIGILDKQTIIDSIVYNKNDSSMIDLLTNSISESEYINTEEMALNYIGKRFVKADRSFDEINSYAKKLLNEMLFPYLPGKYNNKNKFYMLGYMTNYLCNVILKRTKESDKDNFMNKRISTSGIFIKELFEKIFKKFTQTIRLNVLNNFKIQEQNTYFSLKILSNNGEYLTENLNYSFATGNWGIKEQIGNKTESGISQTYERLNYMSAISILRRTVNNTIDPNLKKPEPRWFNTSQWGMFCATETPEGAKSGLSKNLALMCEISSTTSIEDIYPLIKQSNLVQDLSLLLLNEINSSYKIFINAGWYFTTKVPQALIAYLNKLKITNKLNFDVCISYNSKKKEIKIRCDHGRVIRPLFIVNQKIANLNITKTHIEMLSNNIINWNHLLEKNIVEYVDVEKQNDILCGMNISDIYNNKNKKYTHCEINPAMILGVAGSIIPFPNRNAAPRNVFECAMAKQAIGINNVSLNEKFDNNAVSLYYPQQPLAQTKSLKLYDFHKIPAGQNLIVAVACYTGYNQEDSLIINQSSIDRGLFRTTYSNSYNITEELNEIIQKPSKTTCINYKDNAYQKLDNDGLLTIGERITGEDIIVGKTVDIPLNELSNENLLKNKKDNSTKSKGGKYGMIDDVVLTTNDNKKVVKVRVKTERIPEIGDKIASRHGQKGTLGITYRQEDMPFTKNGEVPDLLLNPHAIPSRMTIGHLLESLLGKIGCIKGTLIDATIFNNIKVEDIGNVLENLGFQKYGNETLYNGQTGEQLETELFFCPTFYQRLKHMVDDKVQSRTPESGPIMKLTKQPVKGRSRGGGIRFGEMERDCILSHGAMSVINDRLLDSSDGTEISICPKCGLIPQFLENNKFYCKICDNYDMAKLTFPYAAKLLFQELMSMNIYPRFMLSKK